MSAEQTSKEIAAARDALHKLHQARAQADEALDTQREAVRAAYLAHPELGPTSLARAIGITEGTLRGYTVDLARARRRAETKQE